MNINEIETEINKHGYDRHIKLDRVSDTTLDVWDFSRKISFVQKNADTITAYMYENERLVDVQELIQATLHFFVKGVKEFLVIHYNKDYNIGIVLKHG